MSTSLIYALENVLFYEYIPVAILLCLHIVHKVMNNNLCLRYAVIITYIHTFIMVTFDTGTNFPAVR